MSGFSIFECPVCHNWTLQGAEVLPVEEQNQYAREHLLECFGIPEELAS